MATKKIRYSKVTCVIDGVQAERVQTLGHNVDKSQTKVLELANAGVIQYIDDVPSVSITLDTNDIGSIDTLRLCTDRLIDYSTVATSDARTSAYGYRIKAAEVNSSGITITQADLLDAYVDIMVPLSYDGTNVNRTIWYHYLALSGISWGYDVNGYATENYSFSGDNRTWFLNEYAGAKAIVLRKNNVVFRNAATTQAFYIDSALLPVSSYGACSVIAIGFDSNIIYKSDVANWTISDLTGSVGGATFTVGSISASPPISTPYADTSIPTKVTVIVRPSITTQTWAGANSTNDPGYALVTTSGSVGGKAREFISAKFYNTDGPQGSLTAADAGEAAKLQSVSLDVSPSSEALFELGKKGAFAYNIEEPLPISVTINAFDYDLKMIAQAAGTAFGTIDELTLADFTGANAVAIETYNNVTKTAAQKLKTVVLTQMVVNAVNDNIAVGGDVTTEVGFECSYITCTGSGTNPNV